jgi:hypothetical protein
MTEKGREPGELLRWLIGELTPCAQATKTRTSPWFRELAQGPRNLLPAMVPLLAEKFVPPSVRSVLRQEDGSVLTEIGALAVFLSEHPDSDPTVLSLVMVAVASSSLR